MTTTLIRRHGASRLPHRHRIACFLFCLLAGLSPLLAADPTKVPGRAEERVPARLRPLPLKQVNVADRFWAPRLKIYRERTIPHSWQYMGHEIRALRKAAGLPVEGDLNGTWGEANLYKFMETVAHSLSLFPDAELEKRADEVIDLAARAQRPDGFVHAYILNSKKPLWDPAFLDGSHTGYVLGHMIEAALEYNAATGKRQFLDVACRAADQACRHFLGSDSDSDGKPGFDGHAELEMALVELYRIVPEQRYLDLARAFVEWRGRNKVKPFSETPRAYFQDHLPLRQQRTLEGHAVRAIFFATGVADLALETGDGDYRLAASRYWDTVTMRRMAVTGSIGPRKEHEALGEDYELPLDGYYETCAACGLLDFAHRMFLLEQRTESADVMERVLYNAVLHGIALDGTTSYYMNPLTDRNNPRYNSWVCCPPNLSRTLFQVGRYAYAFGPADLFINLYVGGTATFPLEDGPVTLNVETDYPWDGRVRVRVDPRDAGRFALNLRMPEWCETATLSINGTRIAPLRVDDQGYVRLDREWKPADVVELVMEMPVRRVEAHPNVRACAGRVAIQRGPIIYGFEGLDQPGTPAITLPVNPAFQIEHRPDLLGGVTVIKAKDAEGKPLVAIPFYTLANRDKSWQEVWVVQQPGLKPGPDWWTGKLYRFIREDGGGN